MPMKLQVSLLIESHTITKDLDGVIDCNFQDSEVLKEVLNISNNIVDWVHGIASSQEASRSEERVVLQALDKAQDSREEHLGVHNDASQDGRISKVKTDIEVLAQGSLLSSRWVSVGGTQEVLNIKMSSRGIHHILHSFSELSVEPHSGLSQSVLREAADSVSLQVSF